MKTEIKLEPGCQEPWAEIHTAEVTDEIQNAVRWLSGDKERTLNGEREGRIFPLRREKLELIRVERERTMAYTQQGECYEIRRRLYELEEILSPEFLRISKGALVNLAYIRCVEPTLGGLMQLVTQGGQRECISRKFLPAFKKALGLGGKMQ